MNFEIKQDNRRLSTDANGVKLYAAASGYTTVNAHVSKIRAVKIRHFIPEENDGREFATLDIECERNGSTVEVSVFLPADMSPEELAEMLRNINVESV